jgi:hypothetical protein
MFRGSSIAFSSALMVLYAFLGLDTRPLGAVSVSPIKASTIPRQLAGSQPPWTFASICLWTTFLSWASSFMCKYSNQRCSGTLGSSEFGVTLEFGAGDYCLPTLPTVAALGSLLFAASMQPMLDS